jgi:hypothetical protein
MAAESTAIVGLNTVLGALVLADDNADPVIIVPPPVSPQDTGTAVLGALDAVLSFIVLSDSDVGGEVEPPIIPEPPPPPQFARLYRNPALTQAMTLRTNGLTAVLPANGGNIDASLHLAELFRTFYVGTDRVFSYEPWS